MPNLDELFDKGFICFADNEEIIISPHLKTNEKDILNITTELHLRTIYPENKKYMEHHRDKVYRK